MCVERSGERSVDREGERERLGGRLRRGGVGPRQLGDLGRRAGRERPHHLGGALELRPPCRGERDFADALSGLEVVGGELGAGAETCGHEPAGRGEQRIALEIGPNGSGRAVRGLDVGAGMAEVANGAQVQHRRTPRLTHPVRQVTCGGERSCRIVTVGRLVAKGGAARERVRDPPGRRRNADPDPVVLADEEQRHGQMLVCRVGRRVERGLGGRVVQRCVAEAADDDRVVGPGALDAELARPVDRDRHPHRAGQVRRDRRGLRDHGQLVVAEHLVAAARDRLVDRGGDALHHVGNAVAARLAGTREIEGSGAVVQQRRIGGAQGKGDRRVALVPGRSDRVEGALLLLEPAGRVIAVPALDLRPPERLGLGVGRRRSAGRLLERLEGREKMLLERIEVVGDHGLSPALASSRRTTNGRTTLESSASSHTTAPPGSTSPSRRRASASASSRDSVPMIRCFHWRIGR